MKKVLKITMMIALLFFGKYSSAQNPLWVLAPKYLDEAQNPIPLPTGPSYIPYENYTGFPSQFGASAIANIDNSLKFFVIDGFIYDNDGSYIEYAWSTAQQPTYTVQINDTVYMDYPRGNGSDLIIIPHPLDCEKFYLIASVEVIGDRQISHLIMRYLIIRQNKLLKEADGTLILM